MVMRMMAMMVVVEMLMCGLRVVGMGWRGDIGGWG